MKTINSSSIIVDVFEGQLKSRLMCLRCHCHKPPTFEGFRMLSLEIPSVYTTKVFKIVFIPQARAENGFKPDAIYYEKEVPILNQDAYFGAVCAPPADVVEKSGVLEKSNENRLIFAECYRNRVHCILDDGVKLTDVSSNEQIFLYEIARQTSHTNMPTPAKPLGVFDMPSMDPEGPLLVDNKILVLVLHRRVVEKEVKAVSAGTAAKT